MSAKKTPWFPINVKPVRRGVYEVKLFSSSGHYVSKGYAYWSGDFWGNRFDSVNTADKYRNNGMQTKTWRGLTEPAKKGGAA